MRGTCGKGVSETDPVSERLPGVCFLAIPRPFRRCFPFFSHVWGVEKVFNAVGVAGSGGTATRGRTGGLSSGCAPLDGADADF